MALIRVGNRTFNPVQEFERLQQEINSIFGMEDSGTSQGLFERRFSPAVDILEDKDEFLVLCDLPGVEIRDLEISIASDVLTIKGEKKVPETEKNVKMYKKESWDGIFQRTLSLPNTVDADRIDAVLETGVLRIRLPKKEEVKPRHIQIKAK